jgi:excisionase family DNA binding protein
MARLSSREAARAETHSGSFLSVAEAARRLRVSHSTLWRWIGAGRLPAYRIGPKTLRIKEEDLAGVVQPAGARRKEVTPVHQPSSIRTTLEISPLTDEERRSGLEVLEQIDALQAKMLAERGGQPFPSSIDLIRQMREERSRQLDKL